MKAIITVGISASGKTTWATEHWKNNPNWVDINRDVIREVLFGEEYKFSKKKEQEVTQFQRDLILIWAERGANIIISDTNLNKERNKQLIKFLVDVGYDVEIKEFRIELQEAIKRDLKRLKSVGYEVIHRQWKQWLDYIDFNKYTPDESLPDAVIVDVDGTIADMSGIRGPFEWDKVGLDNRVNVVADIVDGLSRLDYQIIVMSGRDGCCYEDTKKWLNENLYWHDTLIMRTAGDSRKDSIVKEQLFWEHASPFYNVKAVIDDRPQVCRMWRDLGLKVIQVADPYKEF